MKTTAEIRKRLKSELQQKRRFSPSYSARAMARDMGLGTTSLTDFLSGKRTLSAKSLDKVGAYLQRKLRCSWCQKPQKETRYLIGGPGQLTICDTCLSACNHIAKNRVPLS